MRRILGLVVVLAALLLGGRAEAQSCNGCWIGYTAPAGVPATGGTFTGPILLPNGTAGAPALSWAEQATSGAYRISVSSFGFSSNSSPIWGYSSIAAYPAGIKLASGMAVSFGSDSTLSASGDAVLMRDGAANKLQLGLDAATAGAQILKGADSTGATVAGASLTLAGGNGTSGIANGGALILAGGANSSTGEPGAVAISDGGTKPTCAAGIRGSIWYDAGGAGVADTFEVCAKQAAGDSYAWRALATIP